MNYLIETIMYRCLLPFVVTVAFTVTNLHDAQASDLNLTDAVIIASSRQEAAEQQAVRLLTDEVEARTSVRWRTSHKWPADGKPAIVVSSAELLREIESPQVKQFAAKIDPDKSEGFHIHTDAETSTVFIVGNDSRGVLYGVGRLLRELRMSRASASIPSDFKVTSSPAVSLRGHQLGYRPKTNSYDGWDVAQWEQYIRDLVVFGANAVELIPPRSDDDDDSPHFPLPPMEMMIEMSRLLDQYDVDVWIWYPAMDEDYGDPKTVEFALKEWGEVFEKLPRVDAVFVPGGDPGHTHPRHLMDLLEKQAANLKKHHPDAEMWMSPQSFTPEWMDVFYGIIDNEQPKWLDGIVYGPQLRVTLPEFRSRIPEQYPIRRYPDITHNRQSQYPVPNWDLAFAATEGRESINPRPRGQAHIFSLLDEYSDGFITYSEGCKDDVNKVIWSGLGWDPETPVIDILRQYSRYFIGAEYTDDFAQALLALEANWDGPLLANDRVCTTLEQVQDLERRASPELLKNWRFQMVLYRAYYDAYVRSRLLYETNLEERALDVLRIATDGNALAAVNAAEYLLNLALTDPPSQQWRTRVVELADDLFESIKMQLSVQRHQAIYVGRGASLDTLDMPLNNRMWITSRFAEIRKLENESARLKAINMIVNWKNPGPGGFYDDLGSLGPQPRLIKGTGWESDPAFFETTLIGYSTRAWLDYKQHPITWWRNAETLHDRPLQMQYDDLDPAATYRLRVSYASDMPFVKIRLVADEDIEIHPEMEKGDPVTLLEFDIPRQATADGELTLSWYREQGLGGNGRGAQVAEVWLMKNP
ncbi:MAG: hypothetical protein KDA93_09490 [Planctomycetaceae bacterium]|nr:hypothetical protein [Planctomycetaceae bacterium]